MKNRLLEFKGILCFFSIFISFLCFHQSLANNKKLWAIKGSIEDIVTKEPLKDDKTMIQILNKDSTLVDSTFTFASYLSFLRPPKCIFMQQVEKPGSYILRFDHPQYYTLHRSFTIDSIETPTTIDLGIVYLKREKVNVLNEVEVTASKIKFYFDHDTLIYNADVFTTQYGLVLNEILQKMPGVIIKENGEIEANGRRVDALLLNGKDFFNNDRKTLLNNLPAFMVKDVKVYDKTKDSTSLIKREREFEGYVMDVKLKKEYKNVLLGNGELGFGTNNRYCAKLFGMRFNQISSVTCYAMTNNINKKDEITASGTTRTSTSSRGANAWSKVGGSYVYEQPQGNYYLNGNAIIEYEDHSFEYNVISNFIYDKENIFSRSHTRDRRYEITAQTNHMLYFLGNTKWDFTLWPSLKYSKTNSNGSGIYGKFSQDIDDLWGEAWKDSLRSREQTQAMELYGISASESSNKYNQHAWRALLSLDKDIKTASNDNPIKLHARYQYHQTGSDTYGIDDYDQIILKQHTFQNVYSDNNSHDDEEEITINYGHQLGKSHLSLKYSYNRNALYKDNARYALHQLSGWDTKTQGFSLGMLPSAEEMLNALDANNSFTYNQEENLHNVEMHYSLSHQKGDKKKEFSVTIPLMIEDRELHFWQQNSDTLIHRNKCRPDLDVKFTASNRNNRYNGTGWGLGYSLKSVMPTLYNLVNFKDDYNPFYIQNGNPNLKDKTSHRWSANFGYQNEKGYIENIRTTFYLTRNDYVREMKYDAVTSVTETKPANINGNWRWSLNLDNTLFVAKNRMSSVSNEMNISLDKNVDYAYANLLSSSERRTVMNYQVSEKILFRWRSDNTKIHAGGNAYITYRKATSEWEDFNTLEMFDYGMQGDISFELPKNWRLKSDLLTVCRSGYSTVNMNDQEYIWSADLTKSLSERYSFSLECYDILNQRKNVYNYVNAQGCYNAFYNNLRRYIMLHFTVRLNKGGQHHGHVH